MDKGVKRIENTLSHPITIFSATFCTIGSFVYLVYDKISNLYPSNYSITIFILSISFFILVHLLTVRVQNQNNALKDIAKIMHEINHIYRDKLYEVFHSENPIDSSTKLINHEKETLKAVLERVSMMFTSLTGRKCTATVKIIVLDDGGKLYCHTYVRSIEKSPRDTNPPEKFEVGTGKNTAFDRALLNSLDNPSHFYSPDLSKEDEYNNERQNYKKFYISTIVVPVRYCPNNSAKQPDVMGFLCIDTIARNRLNNREHLHLLSAIADQMYNFTSLMRGKYSVLLD